jgi:hypothetical protein
MRESKGKMQEEEVREEMVASQEIVESISLKTNSLIFWLNKENMAYKVKMEILVKEDEMDVNS